MDLEAEPTVLDPTGAEFNQAWVGWKGAQGGVTIGRQRVALDNQRWVGSVGWRQNEQTFDALGAQWKPRADLSLQYYWLDRVHRVAGDKAINRLARERELDSHLLNLAWKRGAQQVVGYTYLHDDRDVASASTATFECFNRSRYAEGDHVIFVGEVERCSHRAGASPLLFHGGRFYTEHPL